MLAAGYKPGFQTRKINHSSASTLLQRLRRNLNAVLRTGRTLPWRKARPYTGPRRGPLFDVRRPLPRLAETPATAYFEGVVRTFREQRRGCTASATGIAFSGNFESYPGTLPKISGLP